MDGNSREEETSKNVETSQEGKKFDEVEEDASKLYGSKDAGVVVVGFESGNRTEERDCGSSCHNASVSGPSSGVTPPEYGNSEGSLLDVREATEEKEVVEVTQQEPHVEVAAGVVEDESTEKTSSLGPPPSYSFVMKQKRKISKPPPPESPVIDRPPLPPPPPTYGGIQGLYIAPDDGQICSIPSFSEPTWRSHSQPAFCPRCGVYVLTTTHSHDSVATHVAVLALCLFGCWPCCLVPYCMNSCKNTYHHCPICQSFLGAYTPW